MEREEPGSARSLRTPKAAGLAGIVFSLLFALALSLFHLSTPSNPAEPGAWLSDPNRRTALTAALRLVPFAGIAFLWFMGVIRHHLGRREDQFMATVFLGSGLLFVAMLFTAAAVAGASVRPGSATAAGVLEANRLVIAQLTDIYALRMAAVFAISTTTTISRAGIVPQWVAVLGYASALVLLVNGGTIPWINLVFTLWTLVLSICFLRVSPSTLQPSTR